MVNVSRPHIPAPRSAQGEAYVPRWAETTAAVRLGEEIYKTYLDLGFAPRPIVTAQIDCYLIFSLSMNMHEPIIIREQFVPSKLNVNVAYATKPAPPRALPDGDLQAVHMDFFVPVDKQIHSQVVSTTCDPQAAGDTQGFPQSMDYLGAQGRQEILLGLGFVKQAFDTVLVPGNSPTTDAT